MLAMESKNAPGESFNVASGKQVSILQLLETLKKITASYDVTAEFAPTRAGDVMGTSVSIEKIQRKLGYKPSVKFEDGLEELVDSMRKKVELRTVRSAE